MSDMAFRLAGPDDAAALAQMVDAMDRYYQDPEKADGATRAAAEGWLRGDGVSDTRFILGFDGEEPVGFAAFAVLYPGNDLRGMVFLKDLFVLADWRRRNIGEGLMRTLARFCVEHRIGRIDWPVETDRAQRFYERLGAADLPHKRLMRFDGPALAGLAEP